MLLVSAWLSQGDRLMPTFLAGLDNTLKVAIIAACGSVFGTVVTLSFAALGTPLKYWLDRLALKNKLEIEYEYEQRKRIRELIGRYRGWLLEAAESLNHRFWNLYENQAAGWLDVNGNYDSGPWGYYFESFIHRFLRVFALTRLFEAEAIFVDPKFTEQTDLDFVKFVKALQWAACDVDLFKGIPYDPEYATDHFFRDELRNMCDRSCSNGEVMKPAELQAVVRQSNGFHTIFQFFDGLKPGEARLRWDRLVALHLFLMAFLNSFGYDMQRSSVTQLAEAATKVQHPQVRDNLKFWIPKLGLAREVEMRKVMDAVQTAERALAAKSHP